MRSSCLTAGVSDLAGSQPGSTRADAQALLKPRFKQRLLQQEQLADVSSQPILPRQVAVPCATWAALLKTLTDLLGGPGRGFEPGRQPVVLQPVTLQLPAAKAAAQSCAADEVVAESAKGSEGPADEPARELSEGQGLAKENTAPDEAMAVPAVAPPRRGRPSRASSRLRQAAPGGGGARSAELQTQPESAVAAVAPDNDEDTNTTVHDLEGGAGTAAAAAAEPEEDAARGGAAEGGAAEVASTPKKGVPARSRASRRLEARRCGRSEPDCFQWLNRTQTTTQDKHARCHAVFSPTEIKGAHRMDSVLWLWSLAM